MPGETTASRTGKRTISICTTGQNKGRFTVILATMGDGRKLKPYVVFKGARPVAALMEIPGVVVAFSGNGWMNEALTMDWVTRVWGTLNDASSCGMLTGVIWWAVWAAMWRSPQTLTLISSLVDSPAIFSLLMFPETNHSKRHTRHSTSGWHEEKKSYTSAGNMCSPSFFTHSMPWPFLGSGAAVRTSPQKRSPHCCVDVVHTHNAVETEHFVHLARHFLRTILLYVDNNMHIHIPWMVAALEQMLHLSGPKNNCSHSVHSSKYGGPNKTKHTYAEIQIREHLFKKTVTTRLHRHTTFTALTLW